MSNRRLPKAEIVRAALTADPRRSSPGPDGTRIAPPAKLVYYRGISQPMPKAEVCEKMCEKCPFRPDGSGYAQDHPDMDRFRRNVEELGIPFYCHETALLDPRTKKDRKGDPSPVPQEHFKQCRGAWEAQIAAWKKRVDAHLDKKKGQ